MSWFSDTFLGTESSSGKRTDYLADRKQGEYEKYAQGWGEQADKFQGMGDEFFDPMSGRNQQRYGMMEEGINDQTTAGIRDWQGAMAQQGMGNAGGIGAQNILQQRRRAGGDTARGMGQAYQQSFGMGMQAAKMGSSERSKGATATGAADQIYAGANQAKMAQDTSNAQKKAGFNQMLGGAALSFVMPGMMGGLTKGLMGAGKNIAQHGEGGFMKGLGGMMQNIAQPHMQSMNLQDASQKNLMRQLNGEGQGGQSFAQNYALQSPRITGGQGMFNTQGSFGQGLMNYGMQNMGNRASAYGSGFGNAPPNPYQLTPNFHGPAQQNQGYMQNEPLDFGGRDWTY
jgi:hypothetical protein